MSLPAPQPGLVISYEYLWWREAQQGGETGRKARPCALVVAVQRSRHEQAEPDDPYQVMVLPITSRRPPAETPAVRLEPRLKRTLGLEPDPSWVILSECNLFTWPGVDLQPIRDSGEWAYGRLPLQLTLEIVEQFRQFARNRALKIVPRGE